MKNTYQLHDTFNNRVISNHRSLDAAVLAKAKHNRAIKRVNGPSSYIPYAITFEDSLVDFGEIMEAEHRNNLL